MSLCCEPQGVIVNEIFLCWVVAYVFRGCMEILIATSDVARLELEFTMNIVINIHKCWMKGNHCEANS